MNRRRPPVRASVEYTQRKYNTKPGCQFDAHARPREHSQRRGQTPALAQISASPAAQNERRHRLQPLTPRGEGRTGGTNGRGAAKQLQRAARLGCRPTTRLLSAAVVAQLISSRKMPVRELPRSESARPAAADALDQCQRGPAALQATFASARCRECLHCSAKNGQADVFDGASLQLAHQAKLQRALIETEHCAAVELQRTACALVINRHRG